MADNDTAGNDTVRLLVFGDLHLRPTGEQFAVADLPIESHDAVVSLGDVVDENRDHAKSPAAGEAYEELGREFFEHLDTRGVPVLAVPGNHDPLECTRRLTDGLDSVSVLHRETVQVEGTGSKACHIAGWGCEQFDFPSALLSSDYPDIPLGPDESHTPDTVADALIRQAGRYMAGNLSREELRESLGIDSPDPQDYFTSMLATLEDRFETGVESIGDASPPVLVASHVSPFGVSFDCRQPHSHEGEYHFGSLALRLALAATGPAGCLSGHTHQRGLTAIETASGHAYAYNPGAPGVASVTVGEDGAIQAKTLDGF